ncbi:MAG: aspartyl-tRNA(Asn)/glutamyl-tRNA(Gln) amidotransferase subunit [Desulfovibrionales bacterium]|nr:aspartyl-tRNA(Asn)/glutamyl-tRNA(Gln) amidotransferase subunit [Desulfovibrionales bacterium]
MPDYEPVIGLEVHAQLKTKTKIFCSCSTNFGDEPNTNVCPVCAGMPGVLPVLNKKVLEFSVKTGLAVNCKINMKSLFARKNYFYPDLPKDYQISMYEEPICGPGRIDIETSAGPKRIGVTRIHLEEDAGKSIHSPVENVSFVDLNRTGVPLMEIVSEPDMRSPEEAVAYLKALRAILVYLDVCDGNMEEGSFRCDANVSVRPRGQKEFGIRTELKNMNSFRHVQRALEYEIGRQCDLLDDGEKVVQETRLFDTAKSVTVAMRTKEEANDYRYFPDPDLPPVVLRQEWIDRWASELPELPAPRRARFLEQYGLPADAADLLTSERALADYFEAAAAAYNEPKKIANWIMTDLLRELNQAHLSVSDCKLAPEGLAALVRLVDEGVISGKSGKDVFTEVFASGEDPEAVVKAKGLVQISDASALEEIVDKVLAANPAEVESYKGGKKKLMGFFVGQIMRETKGQANPGLVNQIIQKKLG